jgi:two-component system, NtrC family, sensor histidine kinase HydH
VIKKITWLIVIRIFLVTLFLSIGAVILKVDRGFFYILIAAVYLLSIMYLVWLLQKHYLKLLGIIQIFFDCLFITVTVYMTGSIESIFTTLYILTILSASIVVSPLAGMVTAALSSFLYLAQLLVGFHKIIPWTSYQGWEQTNVSLLIYTANVHIVTFILVGILSASLARRISQMEERMKEKEKVSLMGELAAQIAHEIRNPLTSISGSVELLQEELKHKLDDKNTVLMNAIVQESHRVSGIFEQFLDFSKLDRLVYTRNSLKSLLDELFLLVDTTCQSNNIIIEKNYQQRELFFESDRDRIKQVFLNLIMNAFEAMPSGGRLIIDAYCKEDKLCIAFIDSGNGIDKKVLPDLFVPFRSTKKKGYGLGLAIASKIVEKHGGTISVITEKNKGSNFIVTLPLTQVD